MMVTPVRLKDSLRIEFPFRQRPKNSQRIPSRLLSYLRFDRRRQTTALHENHPREPHTCVVSCRIYYARNNALNKRLSFQNGRFCPQAAPQVSVVPPSPVTGFPPLLFVCREAMLHKSCGCNTHVHKTLHTTHQNALHETTSPAHPG